MNKLLLFTITFLIAGTLAYSQNSFTITDTNNVDVTGDTVYVVSYKDSTEIIAEFHVTNNNSSTLNVKAKKTEISLTAGTVNTFCWVLCYSPTTYTSSQSLNMTAGQTTSGAEDLSGHLFPQGMAGQNIIAYTIFDTNNPSDSAIVYVVFDILTGINSGLKTSSFSLPYPNPADNSINFNYNTGLNSNIEFSLFNIVGTKILNKKVSNIQNIFTLNTSTLTEGIYFYTITDNNKKIKTGRFTVSH